jgi:hypothetical protein
MNLQLNFIDVQNVDTLGVITHRFNWNVKNKR